MVALYTVTVVIGVFIARRGAQENEVPATGTTRLYSSYLQLQLHFYCLSIKIVIINQSGKYTYITLLWLSVTILLS